MPGECKVLRWPAMSAGSCHLDGFVEGLAKALPYLVYKPPNDFFGRVRLEPWRWETGW